MFFSISEFNCPNIKISRIDIQFIRPNKTNDTDVYEFLEKSLAVFILSCIIIIEHYV